MFGLVEPQVERGGAGYIFHLFIDSDSQVQLHTGATITSHQAIRIIPALATTITVQRINRRHDPEPVIKVFPFKVARALPYRQQDHRLRPREYVYQHEPL